jgi:hypothetical protein
VEQNSDGLVLNLFAGNTRLNVNEVRNDVDKSMNAQYHMDALDFVRFVQRKTKKRFDTVILDPPYSYRKSMEMYNGNLNSRFKLIADELPKIIKDTASIISFGYHSTFMGKKRGYYLHKLCVFAHGGAQHCTIGIIEKKMKSISKNTNVEEGGFFMKNFVVTSKQPNDFFVLKVVAGFPDVKNVATTQYRFIYVKDNEVFGFNEAAGAFGELSFPLLDGYYEIKRNRKKSIEIELLSDIQEPYRNVDSLLELLEDEEIYAYFDGDAIDIYKVFCDIARMDDELVFNPHLLKPLEDMKWFMQEENVGSIFRVAYYGPELPIMMKTPILTLLFMGMRPKRSAEWKSPLRHKTR